MPDRLLPGRQVPVIVTGEAGEGDRRPGFHTERVSEPAEIIPVLRWALDVNTSGRPAYIEFICCQYPVYGQWVGRSAE